MKLSRRFRKGRVFYQYLVSYVLILLIPVVMSVFLFNRASTVLSAEANRANNLLLAQIKSYFDMVMNDVQKLRYLVGYNDRVEGLLYERTPIEANEYYRSYQVARDFFVYKVATTSIEDFYAYFPNLDMIMSPQGYFTTENYYNAWMSRIDVEYSDWLEEFEQIRRVHYGSGAIETESNAVVETIRIVYPLPADNHPSRPRGWLCVHIANERFANMLRSSAWTEESTLLLYHEEYGVIASSRPELADAGIPLAALEFAQHLSTVRIGERRHVLLREASDVTAWSYMSLVPQDVYADRFTDLSRFTILAFVACMVVGGFVIFRFAVARYRPVHHLVELLRPTSEEAVAVHFDEFEAITASLELTLAEDSRLRQEVKRTKPLVAQRYLQQLMKGRIADNDEARAELAGLGITFPQERLSVALIDIEVTDAAPTGTREANLKLLEEGFKPYTAEILRDVDGAVALLVSHDASTAISEVLLQLKTRAERTFAAVWSIGVSKTGPRTSDLSCLYRQARRALDFRLVKGKSMPILFESVRAANQSYDYSLEEETKLINSIKAGDYERAAGILEDVHVRNFSNSALSLEMARCLMFDLIATMVKTVNSIVTPEEDGAFWSRVRPITRLTACSSLEDLRVQMKSTLAQTCRYVRDRRTSHTDQLRKDILDFIHENYADANLSTDLVADALDRNAAYLARFFREQMRIGMSSYIKKYRIDAAKAVLRTEDVVLTDLATRVGFANSNALIRAFKDVEGVTPGQFRESVAV